MEQKTTQTWTVQLEEDPETGQLMLPFPVDLLSQMGWSEGTEICWEESFNSSYILTEKKKTEPTDSDSTVGC
jgi:hypothetical protein